MDARRWRIAAVLTVGVVLVAAPVLILVLGIEDPETSAERDPDGPLAAFLPEAIAFVEQSRGREFLEQPVVVVLEDSEFEALLDADLEEFFGDEPELVEEFTVLYRALRLIDADETIDEEYRAFGGAGVLGFYDPETDELVVRQGDGLSLLTRSTIVHELVHAFDDQHFDLDRPEYDDRTDEIAWTFSAVVEGSASYVETAWEAALSSSDQAALTAEEFSFGGDVDLDEFSLSFLISELSVYEEGEPFVARLVESGGMAAVDDVLAEPLATSEQVMEPARADEPPIDVALPPADGEVVASGNGGQVLIESLLFEVLGPGDTARAGEGWGGDAYVAWREGDRSCIRWDMVADTDDDLQQLREAMEIWVARGDGSVSSPEPGVIRVDHCA